MVLNQPKSDGHVYALNFDSSVAGSALVTTTVQVIADNNGSSDCEFELSLGTQPSTTSAPGAPGFVRVTIPANLPTQYNGGGYLGFDQTMQAVLPVKVGTNTIYFNAQQTKTCNYYGFAYPQMSAVLMSSPSTATLTQ